MRSPGYFCQTIRVSREQLSEGGGFKYDSDCSDCVVALVARPLRKTRALHPFPRLCARAMLAPSSLISDTPPQAKLLRALPAYILLKRGIVPLFTKFSLQAPFGLAYRENPKGKNLYGLKLYCCFSSYKSIFYLIKEILL